MIIQRRLRLTLLVFKIMAKKKIETKETHTCGECGCGVPYIEHSSMDYHGKPICITCPHEDKRKRIRSERACDKWKPKKMK